jgi:fatty acid desaturase
LRALFFACAATGWSVSRITKFFPFLYNTLATTLVLLCLVVLSLVLLRETDAWPWVRARLQRRPITGASSL